MHGTPSNRRKTVRAKIQLFDDHFGIGRIGMCSGRRAHKIITVNGKKQKATHTPDQKLNHINTHKNTERLNFQIGQRYFLFAQTPLHIHVRRNI